MTRLSPQARACSATADSWRAWTWRCAPTTLGRPSRRFFLVVAGSRLVVLDGCCALRASPSGSTQRGTAPRPFAPTFSATLRRHRRRPFADTGGDLSLSPAATLQVRCQRPNPFQLKVKLEGQRREIQDQASKQPISTGIPTHNPTHNPMVTWGRR